MKEGVAGKANKCKGSSHLCSHSSQRSNESLGYEQSTHAGARTFTPKLLSLGAWLLLQGRVLGGSQISRKNGVGVRK